MEGLYQRTELLVGSEGMKRLMGAKVLVVGLGGVGGFVTEALARAGVGFLGLCDSDAVDETNLNRQIIALRSDIGTLKTEAFTKRIGDINADCVLRTFPFRIGDEEQADGSCVLPVSALDIEGWDYIADAIDDVRAKVALISAARAAGVPVISSMGTGNKLDPTAFRVADITQTAVCPLARIMRKELKKRGIEHLKVVYSKEPPIEPAPAEQENGAHQKRQTPGSCAFVPPVAGLIMAGEIVRDLCGIKRT